MRTYKLECLTLVHLCARTEVISRWKMNLPMTAEEMLTSRAKAKAALIRWIP